MEPSPSLSLIEKAKPTLMGRKVAALVTTASTTRVLDSLRKAVEKQDAALAIVAPKIGGVTTAKGKKLPADQALSARRRYCSMQWRCFRPQEGAAALAGGSGHQLAARCVRPSEDHRIRGRSCADIREGRDCP